MPPQSEPATSPSHLLLQRPPTGWDADGKRSATSTSRLFSALDYDGSGILTASEIRKYLLSGIFGNDKSLDTSLEIDNAVRTVVSNLDMSSDGTVSVEDVDGYLAGIDELLSLDETVDWVVHAVQLPTSVGEIFRESRVTGSEFAELLDDDGSLLLTEVREGFTNAVRLANLL